VKISATTKMSKVLTAKAAKAGMHDSATEVTG